MKTQISGSKRKGMKARGVSNLRVLFHRGVYEGPWHGVYTLETCMCICIYVCVRRE